ncbi:MAG: hypothetical protein HN521_12980 [Candidatus Latescibacteria bacterium]|jgi:hypothetical protein|nr:hypothetical protein [Candidatus Latescibacterota bacterium]MBT5832119.1 hypothetical protein [Candidatus Latescibacterota bacterium]
MKGLEVVMNCLQHLPENYWENFTVRIKNSKVVIIEECRTHKVEYEKEERLVE